MTDGREFETECAAEETGYIPSNLVVARKSLIPPTVTDLALSYTFGEERTTITLDRAALDLEPQHDRVDIAIRGFFPGFTITIAPSDIAEQEQGMTDETLIAESERISRNDRSNSRYQDTSGIEYGEEAVATPTSVIFRWGTEGGYEQGSLEIPWPDVLKHAPTRALAEERLARERAHVPDTRPMPGA